MQNYPEHFGQNRYYNLSTYLKNTYGEKYYKIALHSHMTCPNRDGTLDNRGCIFCSEGASGEFAVSGTLEEQIIKGRERIQNKYNGCGLIAYFQSYTNTYAPIEYLTSLFTEALDHKEVVGISIATRPDCLGEEVINLLSSLSTSFPNKFIWVELGLQTIHEKTATYIRRHYPLSTFEKAVHDLNSIKIPFIVHTILGLPGETKDDFLKTINYLNQVKPFGIKLQLLHIIKNTDLATDYEKNLFQVLSQDEYTDWLISGIEQLSPDIVLHRVTGDGNKEDLIAPLWSTNKKNVMNTFNKKLKEKNTWQGKYYDTRSNNTL
jgi:radical SAM protein (TIGR01212 family)